MQHLDTMNSLIIGGIVLLSAMGLFFYFSDYSQNVVTQQVLQQSVTNVGEILDHDFNKLGYRVPAGSVKIVTLDSTRITFLADLNNDGAVDSINYFHRFENSDTSFVRRVAYANIGTKEWQMKIKKFYVMGINESGSLTTNVDEIRSFLVKLFLRNSKQSSEQLAAFWEKKYFPMALQP